MGCGGRRGAAGLRGDASTTGHVRRGDVAARSWGGREWWFASRRGIVLERVQPDDLSDRGRLEFQVLLRQALDALLEVLHLVFDGEQADRRGDRRDRPEQEPAMDHARPPDGRGAIFSAT